METKSTFEDLEVWKMAKDFRKKISSLIKTLPPNEKYRLADQMIRASRSVTANIAEGRVWKISLSGKYSILPPIEGKPL